MLFKKLFFSFAIIFLLMNSAAAQQLVSAKITAIEGQVEIQRNPGNQPIPVKIAFKVDDRLSAGDKIITGKNGRLVLGLSDGSQAVIAPKTTVVIQDLSQSPRTLFEVLKGKTRIEIQKLGGQPNPYRVNTPTAVIAVRGTIFDVVVNDNDTEVFLHEGEVAVTNLRLPNQPVILTAGQTTRVFLQRQPNPPGAFKPGRNDGNFRMAQPGGSGQNGRIADTSGRPPQNRDGSGGSTQRDSGRGVPSTRPPATDTGRGAPPPTTPPRPAGKRP
ncbi:MAG: FecR domain-containing protein [Acidobacteriota bacterium]|nr:FecR domain-containing protein [Acidobacteriota bacterium]